jgi:hypothetical protein
VADFGTSSTPKNLHLLIKKIDIPPSPYDYLQPIVDLASPKHPFLHFYLTCVFSKTSQEVQILMFARSPKSATFLVPEEAGVPFILAELTEHVHSIRHCSPEDKVPVNIVNDTPDSQ